MSFFLLLLLVFFVIIPLWKIGWAYYRARRQMRDIYEAFGLGGQRRQQQQQQRRSQSQQNTRQASRRKKIDPTMGEYVSFEEISETRTSTSQEGSRTTYRHEQQVVDAEWEEVS